MGLCHLSLEHLQSLAHAGRELPEVLQIELHVANQQPELRRYCQAQGIVVVASAPLGRGAVPRLALPGPRSAAEVGLRWALQQGVVAVPKTRSPARLEANAAFGFSLSAEARQQKLCRSLQHFSWLRRVASSDGGSKQAAWRFFYLLKGRTSITWHNSTS